MSKGCVYLVGAGPGDPGLITVRGRELLAAADIVVYDYLVSRRLLTCARADAEMIYVGKQAGDHTLPQDKIGELLVRRAGQGANIVRLKGGDPYVFGRGGEEALDLVEAGIAFEVVPGITAAIAAAAYAGIPVTHRKLASNFGLVTGHETPDKPGSDLDFQALADWQGTLSFYMGVANLGAICKGLIDRGLDDTIPAALIRWGTTTRQQVLVGTVSSLPKLAEDAAFKPPAMIIVGKVVALREKLNWFERRPLFSRRIVVTRARAQASVLVTRLDYLGAEVIEMPTIRIAPAEDSGPLEAAVGDLDAFDWIVFTSANSVDAFFSALAGAALDSRALGGLSICTVGPATAERLAHFGLKADLQPDRMVSSAIVAALADRMDLSGVRILYPRANIAPPALPDALADRGALVSSVVAYRTVPDGSDAGEVNDLLARDEIDWITFTSSSTVKNFFDVIKPDALRGCAVRFASIGPSTTATLAEVGFEATVEPESHTIEALVDAITDHEANN